MSTTQRAKNRKPMKRGSIDTIFTQIKTMMYNQELAPGQKLIYQDLAHRLNVSTTPILQALHRLESAKLVRYEQNKGFFVGEITETEARELYQAREALEIYLIPILMEKLTKKRVQEIRNSFRIHKNSTAPNDRRKLMLTDAEFHLTIAKASEHKVIVDLLSTIMERIYIKYKAEYLGEERIKGVLKHHRDILESLEKKDVATAIRRTRDHIQSGMSHMVESLKNRHLESL
ncbi:MAG: GntR family transcriptional regulator [Deltaproteobacteria bacterium]|jgi:DNA-binding GntR family transcriptional regulator|nr:GntR family transcriptional regulator [Deltaproteobacteria bacterium]